MIYPFIQKTETYVLGNRAIQILTPIIQYLRDINEWLDFNLVFGKFKTRKNMLTCGGMVKKHASFMFVVDKLEYIYYEYIINKDCEFTIFLDLETIYEYMGDIDFDLYVRETFLHEYRHIYQVINNIHDLAIPVGYTEEEYNNLPCEIDADNFACEHNVKVPTLPFTLLPE